jgi:hypothetical protein
MRSKSQRLDKQDQTNASVKCGYTNIPKNQYTHMEFQQSDKYGLKLSAYIGTERVPRHKLWLLLAHSRRSFGRYVAESVVLHLLVRHGCKSRHRERVKSPHIVSV